MTKFHFPILIFLALLGVSFTSCDDDDDILPVDEEIVAIANRGSGSVSFIDVDRDVVLETLTIPGSEPMYAVYVPDNDMLYVGDRANNVVHMIDPGTRTVANSIPAGNGVFHMWAAGTGSQLWVNNDIDYTTTVIELDNNTVVQTIPIGEKPHDVFVTADGGTAFISIFNQDPNLPDSVFMYSTATFQKTGAVAVGKDPHLYHLSTSNTLFVPCQSGELYVLNGDDLGVISNKSFFGAHGIFPSRDREALFVANLPGNQLYSIEADTYNQIGSTVTTQTSTPHNIVVNEESNKLYLTHSGMTANSVSVYTINNDYTLTYVSTVNVQTNPFGLAYYHRNL